MKNRKIFYSILIIIAIFLFLMLSLVSCKSSAEVPSLENPTPSAVPKSHVHTWKDATCTAPKTCEKCAQTEGKALEHSYEGTIVSEATCNAKGTKKFECKNCDHSYTEEFSLEELSANEIYELTKASVGEIVTYKKNGTELALGTGFVYKSTGEIVTNYHVIEDAYSAKITIDGKNYTVNKILAYDKTKDIAILKVDASNLVALNICYNQHAVGKAVYAFGSSKGLTETFSQGIITYADREIDGVTYVQHDAAISSGNSGGPLINLYGEVIGINTMTMKDSQNLNFAISVNELKKLSYGTALSFKDFYEKESDAFVKLKNYLCSEGEYDAEDKEYHVLFGYSNSSDYSTRYYRMAYYNVETDDIDLVFAIDTDNLINITIESDLSGEYDWFYYDNNEFYFSGTLYANTYDSNTLLGYDSCNISNSSLRSTTRELASAMVDMLCLNMDKDFKSIGITAEDLGFYYY